MSTAEEVEGVPAVSAASAEEWRAWLAANAGSAPAAWLIVHNTRSGRPTVALGDAVEHALCYGWTDSKALRRDGGSRYQRFSPRNPRSTWSRVNRDRVERLTAQGLMTPAGQALVDLAKATGRWDVLGGAGDGELPDDLRQLFDEDPTALGHFQAFPPSSKRLILELIAGAKRPETRRRRLAQTVESAHDNVRANHPPVARRSAPGGRPAPVG